MIFIFHQLCHRPQISHKLFHKSLLPHSSSCSPSSRQSVRSTVSVHFIPLYVHGLFLYTPGQLPLTCCSCFSSSSLSEGLPVIELGNILNHHLQYVKFAIDVYNEECNNKPWTDAFLIKKIGYFSTYIVFHCLMNTENYRKLPKNELASHTKKFEYTKI